MAMSPPSSHALGANQTRAYYTGSAVTIANGASGTITWNTKALGDALLNIAAPAAPTIVTAGVYALTAQITPTPMTVGGTYSVSLDLDFNGDDASTVGTSPAAVAGQRSPVVSLNLTYFLPAAGLVKLAVTNNDGSIGIDFFLALGVVQRLS